MVNKLPPETIVIRPPVEAYSVLIAVTGGCSWSSKTGGCKFCGTYNSGVYGGIQEYAVRDIGDVKKDIDYYEEKNYKGMPVFLAGGNPTSTNTDYLAEIVRYTHERLRPQRVSCYAKALDILRKADEELEQLAEAGLDIVYMGLESGSSKILRIMRKGTNAESMITAGKRILQAGIKLSLYIILGLGGKKYSEDHVKGTARVLTEINPTIFRFRTLHVIPGSPLYEWVQEGEFQLLSPLENIKEEHDIIANLGENVDSAVYNDHISNYCTLETDNIKKDRERFLIALKEMINDPKIQNLPRKHLVRM
ncbi:MAG: radical SAM protein [Promethearchaeota archaeon]|nr:MAG: radical SAM protein [Candidatus Lokiarchaeota archaeon]